MDTTTPTHATPEVVEGGDNSKNQTIDSNSPIFRLNLISGKSRLLKAEAFVFYDLGHGIIHSSWHREREDICPLTGSSITQGPGCKLTKSSRGLEQDQHPKDC